MKAHFLRRKKKKKKIFVIILIIFLTLIIVINYLSTNVTPLVMNYCRAKIETLTVNAVNNAITMVINDGIDYSDLIDVDKDENGNVSAIKAKTAKINLLARQISSLAQQNLEKTSKKGIGVPIGAFLNSPILAGYGSEITVNFLATGAVDCSFTSEFSEASINHTLHKIFIKVFSEVNLVIPFLSETIKTVSEVLVSECVLIGKVPDTYLKAADLNDMMDLIPEG